MVERATSIQEETDELELDDAEDDEIQLSWQRIFLLVTEMSQTQEIEVNEVITEGPLEINGDETYSIRVHPAIRDHVGNLETISLNLYHDGIHVQQVIAKAKWENGTPDITDIDNDPMEDPQESLGLAQIAIVAEDHLNKILMEVKQTIVPIETIFPVPYSLGGLPN